MGQASTARDDTVPTEHWEKSSQAKCDCSRPRECALPCGSSRDLAIALLSVDLCRSGDIHGMTGAREARDGTTADILARCLRNVHACTSERVKIHMMKSWASLSGKNSRVGR